jgi:hypothetical protein
MAVSFGCHVGPEFNTCDRPKVGGRWSRLAKAKLGGWYNAEYLPHLAACVDGIVNLGYPKETVQPAEALQLDLAILDDLGRVVVVGDAKWDRDVGDVGVVG